MLELNFMFDNVHKSFDFRINNALQNQTLNLKILNAQLFSRLGFVTDEMTMRERESRREIEARAIAINDPNAECIVSARESIDNAVEYAGYSINGLIGEVMYYVNEIEHNYFYPLIHVLQFESNIIQWSVKATLRRYNPVINMTPMITRLQDDYNVVTLLYQISIGNIAREMVLIDEHMNTVKQTMFPQLNGIRDYFGFTADRVKDSLPFCEATPEE